MAAKAVATVAAAATVAFLLFVMVGNLFMTIEAIAFARRFGALAHNLNGLRRG